MAKAKKRRSLFSPFAGFLRGGTNSYTESDDTPYTLGEAGPAGSSSGGSGKRDPSMTLIKKIGLAMTGGSGNSDFEEPEWDFNEITNAYNTEAYIRQAVDKYIEMMFKAGWEWVGKNPNAVEYVRQRFRLMSESTQIPTNQLFIEIAEDLVKYCNVVIAKARAKDINIFAGLSVQPVGDKQPVAGYFPLNLTTMSMKRDKNGTVKNWQQETDDNTAKFRADDIVHIYYKREKGRGFGTPWLIPALEDVRSLRQIEENVLRLVYRHLHPMWHVQVGGTADGQAGESEEVEAVREEVENMDVEGGLVTTERVKITPVASNNALDAKGYLEYFENRVFTDLGVSQLLMGRGGTANRSTGDTLSTEFKDRIKALQSVMAMFVNDRMVNEVLLEGGFDPVLNPDDEVRFTFNEIDLDSKIKAENQAVYLYEHNAISESEMRELLGRDPIEDGEVRAGMHLQVITLATAAANAAAKATDTGETDNKNKPTNQHGTKTSPKKTTNSGEFTSFVESSYKELLFAEYATMQRAIRIVINNFNEKKEQSSLNKVSGVLEYSRMKMKAHGRTLFDEATASKLDVPIERLTRNLQEQLLESVTLMSDYEDLLESIFDVYRDTLSLISDKAEALTEDTQEVNQ